jgi:hypothetical protein
MYLSKYLMIAWLLATVSALALSIHRRHQAARRARRVRSLERTVEKLRRKNGKLWYELMGQEQTTPDRSDLTVTRV